MTKPLTGFTHARVNGKLRAIWDDGRITAPVIRGGDEGEENNPPTDTPKTFTQEEVNRLIQERVARVKAETPPDYAELQAKAARLDEIEAANATELERAQKRAEEAEAKLAAATEVAAITSRRAAVIAAASKAGAVDPEVVAELLANSDAVTIDDAGRVTGADTAVKALLEEKTFLAGPGHSIDQGQGQGRGSTAGEDAKSVAARLYESRHPNQT